MPKLSNARLPEDATTRRQLHDEVHARPVARIRIPALVTHIAVLHDDVPVDVERDHLRDLVGSAGGHADFGDPTFVQVPLPDFTIRWERHGEFSLYSVIQPVDQERLLDNAPVPTAPEPLGEDRACDPEPEAGPATGTGPGTGAEDGTGPDTAPDLLATVPVPGTWLSTLPGRTISAMQVLVLRADGRDGNALAEDARRMLGPERLYGSSVKDGTARLFTTYRLTPDGTSRFLFWCHDVTDGRAGRMVASLTELETYRLLAMQAFRPARAVAATLPRVESRLAELTRTLETGSDQDETLLHDLIQLAAEIETDLAEHTTRFAATRAYFGIAEQRIDDLRGTSLPGMMGVFTFLRRRLLPAMATVESTARRLSDLSERVDRAGDLLRTRVGITTETQNQELLRSIGRGQRLQLRLQETVEGLSIAAITYYVVGLAGYAGKGVKALGVPVNTELFTGASVPVAAALVWWTLRRVKARLHD
ncbi:MAG: DUF3422 domain-containing protein [Kineosporiaceae bacterium]|jgi:uncharacterized membrane-anchored protein